MTVVMPSRPTLLPTSPRTLSYAELVARRVRIAFRMAECSCADLERVLGRSHNLAYSRWSGQRAYRVDELERIARFLDVPIGQLLEVRISS